MDPEATYQDFLDALAAGDVEIAGHRLSDLATWVTRGGFAPKRLSPTQAPDPELARTLRVAAVVLAWAAKDLKNEGETT